MKPTFAPFLVIAAIALVIKEAAHPADVVEQEFVRGDPALGH